MRNLLKYITFNYKKLRNMDIVNIQKRDAIAAYNKADNKEKSLLENLFGKELFNQSLSDRVKTMKDVYYELGIDGCVFEKSFIFQEDLDAAKVRLITKVFNEGWFPDWTNSNETKYTCYFESKNSCGFSYSLFFSWFTHSAVGSRLCFKSKELALSVPRQFKTEFENYFLVKK